MDFPVQSSMTRAVHGNDRTAEILRYLGVICYYPPFPILWFWQFPLSDPTCWSFPLAIARFWVSRQFFSVYTAGRNLAEALCFSFKEFGRLFVHSIQATSLTLVSAGRYSYSPPLTSQPAARSRLDAFTCSRLIFSALDAELSP